MNALGSHEGPGRCFVGRVSLIICGIPSERKLQHNKTVVILCHITSFQIMGTTVDPAFEGVAYQPQEDVYVSLVPRNVEAPKLMICGG